MQAKKQYLNEVREEYRNAEGVSRSKLLDEAQKRTGLNRKYLIRTLNQEPQPKGTGKKRRKRKAEYGAAVVSSLIQVWEIFEQPCGQRLVAVLGREVDRLRASSDLRCTDEVAEKLKQMSASTVDRLLRREKGIQQVRRNRNPGAHRLIYQKVPVKVASEWDTNQAGNLQIDFVLHCGRSAGGDYIHTLSAVDIATQWWEGQAIAVRSQHATKEGLSAMKPRFPFPILELHPDNDSALVNDLLWSWCEEQKIRLSRSRPYKKNDNAWVEQKNWTHVRKVIGYARYDTTRELRLINEIYRVLRLYKNFFQPTIKLMSKTRVAGRIKRIYEKPKTPYERALATGQVDSATKQKLKALYQSLNAASLHRELNALRNELNTTREVK